MSRKANRFLDDFKSELGGCKDLFGNFNFISNSFYPNFKLIAI